MSQTPPQQKKVLLIHLDWNLQRLDEVLNQGSTEYFKSAALQRFGHTYTMAMKSICGFGQPNTEETNDQQCIELASQNGWTEEQLQWEEMIADYKCINQKPNEQEAEAIYQKLPRYQKAFKYLYVHLQNLT
jgi:hypothetical protein